jgi:hypothetical protein
VGRDGPAVAAESCKTGDAPGFLHDSAPIARRLQDQDSRGALRTSHSGGGRHPLPVEPAGGGVMLVLKHVYPAHGSDGETYEVHVYAESADPEHGKPVERLKSVVLADGRELRVVAKGRYELPDGSLKLESHDHEAI